MKLYGVPIAAIRQKDNPQLFDITCTPIAVSDTNLDQFEILDDLKFKATFDINNIATLMECFEKAVDTLDKVVQRQKQSLAEHGMDYRPVALHIGQDNTKPIALNVLYMLLFGEKFIAQFPDELLTYVGSEMDVAAAKNLRSEFLATNPNAAHATYEKLGKLSKECSLQEGSYGNINSYEEHDTSENLQQTNMDRKLIRLRHSPAEGDFSAHYKLINIAREYGKILGAKVTENPQIFQYNAPYGYAQDQNKQEECPTYSFYYWDEAYRKAFYEGFHETYLGPYPRHLKLPLDPPSPPFTDPCADSIRAQFEIIKGRRSPDGIIDRTKPRWLIAEDARQISSNGLREI